MQVTGVSKEGKDNKPVPLHEKSEAPNCCYYHSQPGSVQTPYSSIS